MLLKSRLWSLSMIPARKLRPPNNNFRCVAANSQGPSTQIFQNAKGPPEPPGFTGFTDQPAEDAASQRTEWDTNRNCRGPQHITSL